jgi:hypothetical protein
VRLSAASPDRAAFPELRAGRRPQPPFRALLRLHSRNGRPIRSAAHGDVYCGASILPAARPTACQLSDRPTVARVGLAPTRCSRPSGTTHQTARNWRAHGTLERDDYVGEETFVLANGSRVQLSTLPTPVNHNWRTHGNRCKMRHQQQRGIIDPVGTELSQKCHVVVHQQRTQYTRARMI